MLRTLHVFLFCCTWALVHVADNWLAIHELSVCMDTLRLLQELQDKEREVQPSAEISPDAPERPRL